MNQRSALVDSQDAVFALLDHQAGLLQTVKDIAVSELRTNIGVLAKVASMLEFPVITSASEPMGPNGPLVPEVHELAPHAVFVPRQGEINAWDNDLFVNTFKDMGRKTLIIAGVWTSVCVAFPAGDDVADFFSRVSVPSGLDPSRNLRGHLHDLETCALSLRGRGYERLIRRIDDEHGEQPRGLRLTGVGAHPMVRAGVLEPGLAGLVDTDRLVINLTPDVAG
jgi:hypothetical protein